MPVNAPADVKGNLAAFVQQRAKTSLLDDLMRHHGEVTRWTMKL